MSTSIQSAPPPLPRRSLLRRLFIVAFVGAGLLIVLVPLAFLVENWRGSWAWNKFGAEWEAKGERFDLASIVPAPGPAEKNFAMTPLLAPLLDLNYESGKPQWNNPDGKARAMA